MQYFSSYTGQFWWEGSLRVLALKVLFVRLGVWHLRLLKIKPVKVRIILRESQHSLTGKTKSLNTTIQVNSKVSSQPVLLRSSAIYMYILCKVVLTVLVNLIVSIQMKVAEQYFPVMSYILCCKRLSFIV